MKVPKPRIAVDRRAHAVTHGRADKDVIVLHSTESDDATGTRDVEGILTYLERQGLGVQFCVDGAGNIGQGARLRDIVYHAAGANTRGIGIEMIGHAAWRTRRWLWDPTTTGRRQRRQLAAVIHLVAWSSCEAGIPLKRSTVRGVAQHADFPEGGHWDPGPGFPMGYVMRRARQMKQAWARRDT